MSERNKNIMVFIEPPSDAYNHNILFAENNEHFNRDNCLEPFIYLKKFLEDKGYEVCTADYLKKEGRKGAKKFYFSLGALKNYKKLAKKEGVILSALFIFEPPVVAPEIYKKIAKLSGYFKKIFIHTTGMELKKYIKHSQNVSKFYWPQPYNDVIEESWSIKERKFLTMINGNKKPRLYVNELYSKRIEAVSFFSKYAEIDLYGFGWDKPIVFLPYWLNRKAILESYRGSVKAKYEILSHYKFAICFENMVLPGYITEKIFDCFFTGTVPIYLGAPDIEDYIPRDCFIDMRNFKNYGELRDYLYALQERDIENYRRSIYDYLHSEKYFRFTKEYFAEFFYDCLRKCM